MDRRRIGFDIDGVLFPWHELLLENLIQSGELDVGTTLGQFFNLPDGIIHTWSNKKQKELTRNPRHYIRPFLREGALDILEALASHIEIFYITSRPSNVESPTKAWVRGMGLPYRGNVYVTNGGKRALVEILQLDIFVEDRIKYVEELHDICAVILVTRPWNKDYHEDNHVRVDELYELPAIIMPEKCDNEGKLWYMK
ncbi:MAG: hypothetical protein GQ507_03655 [Dehalococcoidales bacterium]|nr:hypothetical protein [Dehalococcoidales bacterium]